MVIIEVTVAMLEPDATKERVATPAVAPQATPKVAVSAPAAIVTVAELEVAAELPVMVRVTVTEPPVATAVPSETLMFSVVPT